MKLLGKVEKISLLNLISHMTQSGLHDPCSGIVLG